MSEPCYDVEGYLTLPKGLKINIYIGDHLQNDEAILHVSPRVRQWMRDRGICVPNDAQPKSPAILPIQPESPPTP